MGEPKRGGAEEALEIMRATGGEYTASSLDWDSFLDVLRVRTNLLVFMQVRAAALRAGPQSPRAPQLTHVAWRPGHTRHHPPGRHVRIFQ